MKCVVPKLFRKHYRTKNVSVFCLKYIERSNNMLSCKYIHLSAMLKTELKCELVKFARLFEHQKSSKHKSKHTLATVF